MHHSHKTKIAMWVAVGGIMTLVVTLWLLLLPMQLENGTLFGAREIAQWQVYRPQVQEVSKSWADTMDKWHDLVNEVSTASREAADADFAAKQSVSATDIEKLKARIDQANATNQVQPAPKPDEKK